MRGAVLRDPEPGGETLDFGRLRVEPVRLGEPRRGEVLVRIAFASLCHSDLSVLTGDRPRPLPMLLGHEASGVVVEVGDGVDGFAAGDHVVFTYVPACGTCQFCSQGRPALCSRASCANTEGRLLSGGSRLTGGDGGPINHHLGISAFAEYAVVDAHSLIGMPADVPLRDAALFGCAVTTGVGAVINAADVSLGEAVAVIGCGGVGLAAILGLRAVGAAPVVAIDTRPEQLELALSIGADAALLAGETSIAEVAELTAGGVDTVIEASGSQHALAPAYAMLRRGGTLVMVGLAHPSHRWPISPSHLVANDITVRGSYMGSSVPARDIPRFVRLYQSGRLPVDRLIGTTMPLADAANGMAALHAGTAGRLMLDLQAS